MAPDKGRAQLVCGHSFRSNIWFFLRSNKSVNPKGNQPWIFIERTDAEAEVPVLWPPDVKSWLIGKDPDAGKHWGQGKKRVTDIEMVGWHHPSMDMSLSKLQKIVRDREAWHAMGPKRVVHEWETEPQISVLLLNKKQSYAGGCAWGI